MTARSSTSRSASSSGPRPTPLLHQALLTRNVDQMAMSRRPAESHMCIERKQRHRGRGKEAMGQPVVHFEVVGKDAKKLRDFYGELAGWQFDVYEGGPTDYGVVSREGNTNSEGVGIG